MDKPGGGGPALAAAGRGNVAYSNVSGNGGVNEQESEHAQMTAMTAVGPVCDAVDSAVGAKQRTLCPLRG